MDVKIKESIKGEFEESTKSDIFKTNSYESFKSKTDTIPLVKLTDLNLSLLDNIIKIEVIIKSVSGIILSNKEISYQCGRCDVKSNVKVTSCKYCASPLIDTNIIKEEFIRAIVEEADSSKLIDRVPLSITAKFSKGLGKTITSLKLGSKYYLEGKLSTLRTNKTLETFELDISSFEYVEDSLEKKEISYQDIEKIKLLASKEDIITRMSRTIFGNHLYGLDLVMESIILQMVSCPKTYVTKDVLKNRGNIMILLVGSPGTGKSILLKSVASFFPKSRYSSGSNASAIGLVASVQKDDRIGDYVLSPGALPLCHEGGILSADEFDKIDKKDLTKLNTQMDSLKIPVDKANLHRIIPCDVSILGAMNPKYGSFDNNEAVYNQINLQKDFMDRFDLIFNIDYFYKDKETENKALAQSFEAYMEDDSETIDSSELLKFFSYVRKIDVKMDRGVASHIQQEYKKLINKSDIETSYFSKRLVDNIIRLTCAYSRLRLSTQPDFVDVKNAINIMIESFKSLGIYSDTSGLNQFKTEAVIDYSSRDKMRLITNLLKSSKEGLSYDGLASQVSFDNLDEILDLLKRNGQIYEPKSGIYRIL